MTNTDLETDLVAIHTFSLLGGNSSDSTPYITKERVKRYAFQNISRPVKKNLSSSIQQSNSISPSSAYAHFSLSFSSTITPTSSTTSKTRRKKQRTRKSRSTAAPSAEKKKKNREPKEGDEDEECKKKTLACLQKAPTGWWWSIRVGVLKNYFTIFSQNRILIYI